MALRPFSGPPKHQVPPDRPLILLSPYHPPQSPQFPQFGDLRQHEDVGLVSEIQAIPPNWESLIPYLFFTRWFNRDNPGGFGDHETLDRLRVEYPGEICSNPISIEAQTVSGVPAWQTGQVFVYYNTVHGFACVNHQQVNRTCLNYKMLCVILFASGALAAIEERRIEAVEVPPCPRLCYTQWFDRDDPSGYGDYETLLNLRAENPGKICDHPYSIQAQTLTGVFPTGQVFAYYDTVNGFACVNAQQKKPQRCLDYKVRFVCLCSELYKEEIALEETY
ncbi:hypothetical protein QTP86_015404, partial [Hemibagrus guttatus]